MKGTRNGVRPPLLFLMCMFVRWMEQDPSELVTSVITCMDEVGVALQREGKRLSGVGITNQRESTVLWDKTTGQCLYNCIGWLVVVVGQTLIEL